MNLDFNRVLTNNMETNPSKSRKILRHTVEFPTEHTILTSTCTLSRMPRENPSTTTPCMPTEEEHLLPVRVRFPFSEVWCRIPSHFPQNLCNLDPSCHIRESEILHHTKTCHYPALLHSLVQFSKTECRTLVQR